MTLTEELLTPIDPAKIRQRPGAHGMTISYIEGYVVIDELNAVFGPLGWETEVRDMQHLRLENVTREGEISFIDAYRAGVRLTVREAATVIREDYGFAHVVGSTADAHETAMKGAVTDALKRCARTLGPRFGNHLYASTEAVAAPPRPLAPPSGPPPPTAPPSAPAPSESKTCPVHGVPWIWNKNGREYHFDNDRQFCNPINGYWPALLSAMQTAGGWTKNRLDSTARELFGNGPDFLSTAQIESLITHINGGA